jgi:hypothetical protein
MIKKLTLILSLMLLNTNILNAEGYFNITKVKVEIINPIYKNVVNNIPFNHCQEVREKEEARCNDREEDNEALFKNTLSGQNVDYNYNREEEKIWKMNELSEDCFKIKVVQKCKVITQKEYVAKITGYENIAYLNGKKIIKISKNKLDYLEIKTEVKY